MSLIFDTHAHYDDSAFNEDREEILSGLKSNGVGFVVDAAARCSSIPKIIELTEKYDFLYGAAGLHPTELYKMECGEDDSIRGNKDFYAGDKEFEYHVMVTSQLRKAINLQERELSLLS